MKKHIKLFGLLLAVLVLTGVCGSVNVSAGIPEEIEEKGAEWYEERCGLKETEIYEEEIGDDEVLSLGRRMASPEDAYWKKFSSDYYYNRLSDAQKRLWDDLEAGCLEIITGTQNSEYTPMVYNENGLDRTQLINVVHLFRYSNPQYYFLDSSLTLMTNQGGVRGVRMKIYDDFQNGEARRYATANFRNRIDEWVGLVNAGKYDEDKEKIAFDLLADNTVYDLESAYNQSAYSLICNGRTVCAGYTGAMQILMNAVGIDTIEVTSSTHAWNLIKLHDEWYAVDATWGDLDYEWSADVLKEETDNARNSGYFYGMSYAYYNKSNATIQSDNNSHQPEQWWNAYMPEAKYDSTMSSFYQYYTPYFTEDNYVYFMVNDNDTLDSRYAKVVDVLGSSGMGQVPTGVLHNGKEYIVKGGTEGEVRSFVRRLYTLVLHRNADEAGLESWSQALINKKSSGVDAGYGFIFSDECRERNLSNDDFVEILYNTFMNRPSDEGGKTAWVSQLNAGVDREKVFEGFVLSAEFSSICNSYGINVGSVESVPAFAGVLTHYRNRNASLTKFVARCYTQALGRTYETEGLEDWCRVIIEKGNTPKQVAQNFIFSDEFVGKNLNNEEYVKVLYRTFMGREADEGGLAAWVGVLKSGRENRAKVLEGFSDSAEFAEILASFGLN